MPLDPKGLLGYTSIPFLCIFDAAHLPSHLLPPLSNFRFIPSGAAASGLRGSGLGPVAKCCGGVPLTFLLWQVFCEGVFRGARCSLPCMLIAQLG